MFSGGYELFMLDGSVLLAFGFPGGMELFIVAAIVLLLFGNRLPSVMRSLGRGVVEFKRGVQGVDDEIEDATSATSAKPVSHDSSSEDQTTS